MPYQHFRFIAYEVPTATSRTDGTGGVVCDFAPGAEATAVARLPVPNDVPDDPRIRLRRLAAVVDLAAQQLQTLADDAQTLKVFVVPEFYFRPPSGMGADYEGDTYPTRVFNALIGAMDRMFVHADFSNWLFVPGTVLWNTKLDPSRPALFLNTLMHIRGGPLDQPMRLIEKNQPSSIDGMPKIGIPAKDESYKLFHQSWKTRKSHVDWIDGVPTGFEVCLDHNDTVTCRVLKTVLSKWTENEGGNVPALSLHILSAGGMPIKVDSVAAKINGYILRNDGKANPGARSELRQVQAYNTYDPLLNTPFAVLPSDLNGKATLGPNVNEELSVPMPDPLKVPERQGYRTFPQRIVFYPTCGMA